MFILLANRGNYFPHLPVRIMVTIFPAPRLTEDEDDATTNGTGAKQEKA
jgi:hypothetical protein